MKTFTNYAEKKAKQFLNLLHGYTKGIRITAILILLLMGIGQAWAGNHNGGYAIFDNSTTKWTTISMFIGHDTYSRGDYKFTNITNTQLYYLQFTNSNKFEGWKEWMLWNNSWAGENNSISHRKAYFPNGSKYSGTNTSYEITSGVCFISAPTSTTNGWALNPSYYASYTGLNTDQKATVQSTTDGSTYSANANAGSVSISTYKLKSTSASESSTGTTSASAARTAVVTMTATAKTGYTFVNWCNSSGTQQTTNVKYTYTCSGSSATYYARFKANQYTVTLDNQGATTTGAESVTATYTAAMPSIASNLPKKTGYTFKGYYDATSGGTQYYKADGSSNKNWDKTAATTLYAQWTINSHKVTWKANEGNWSGSTADKVVTYNYGATITEQAVPTRVGYEFAEWSPAFVANTTMPDNDLTYTAQWTAKTYTVTLDANGGTDGTTSVIATYGQAMPSATMPTRTGYTFNGYFDATSGGTKYYNANGTSARTWNKTSNTTLYAQWTINRYTITYGVFGGANGTIQLDSGNKEKNFASTTAEYNTSHTLVAEPDNNETHKREGWYSDVACTKKIADGSSNTYSFTLTNDMTVYVKFVEAAEVMSQVIVDANKGGTVSPSGTVQVGNKTPTTFTATPDPGYRFDHWTYSEGDVKLVAGSNTHEQISIIATGEGKLTAVFTPIYSINFFATPITAGSVTAEVNDNDINSGDEFDAGTEITFTATPANKECNFIGWVDGAGETLSTETTYIHTIEDDITIKGIFKINQYTLTFSAGEGGHVSAIANNSAIASPANLDYNTSVTLTAEPDAGCMFLGWFDGNTQHSSDAVYTTKLTADRNREARFQKGTTVYMKAIEYWKKDHPRYAIYYWKSNEDNGWYDMTNVDCNGDIYEGYVPAGYTNFKFVRLAPSTSNEWENKWNETPDLKTTNHAGEMYIQPHVYLKPSSNWKSDGARFAARFWNDGGGETWMSMNDLDGDGVYSCEIPTGYAKVIFVRMNGSSTENNWDNKWNQTIDLDVPTNNNILYTLTNSSWERGTWSAGPHKNGWQTYAEPSYKITYSKPANGTITVTKAGNNVDNGTSLNMGDEIKITFTPADGYELINYNVDYATETGEEGVYSVCGPTKITAEFAKAGTARTVYLRPNEDWLRDEPIFAAYAWNSKNNTQNHWYIMTTKADDYTGAYSCNISSTYDWVTFVRIKPAGRDGSDGSLKFENAWNQTKDLAIIDKDNDKTNDNKLRFAIGDKVGGEGGDKEKYDGKWEENTPIWGLTANFNDWKAEKAVFKGFPGHLDVMPPFGTSHEFKLYNFVYENNKYLGNAGTMKRANSGQWWTMDASEQADCKMMLDVKGDYIYQMRFLTVGSELRKQISVTYPEADTKYALLYKDNNVSRISYDIPAVTGEQNDIISFFVDRDANPTIKLLVNTTETGDAINVSVPERGVYNFVLQQNEGEVTVIAANPEPYKGNYYIRTDAASGGWGGYKQNGNKMTYTSYADNNHNFDHYYTKWITSSESSYTNVKFCVANDYSHKLSDELDGDEIIEKAGVHTGCLPEDANVRFGWDSKTNELSRAYISGSAKAVDRFLVLTGNEYLLDIEGEPIPVGTDDDDRKGLLANEDIFDDMGNWVYQLDVQANKQTAIKLTAQFNDRVQTFFGDARAAEGVALVMDATSYEYYKVRMIYNFKTNHLLAAWLLDRKQEINNGEITSNVLIIRENHGEANQLQFNNGLTKMTINTAYAAMTFTKDHVTDKDLNQWQRYEYWVSFPFNVKISDVFGFGEYGTDWIMQLYDGAERAEKGNWIDSPTFWKYITNRNYELQAGVGYVLKLQASKMTEETAFMYSDKVSLYFPSITNDAGNTIISATPDTQHEIPERECTIERDNRNIYDSHWNLIGVPGYANIADFKTDASLSPVEYKNGEVSFYYEYNAADNTYQATSAESDFKNMHSYMVQFAGTINWSTKKAVKPAELAARRNSDAEPEKRTLRLEIAQGEEVADQTFVQLQQEGATPEFDMNLDLTKIINSGTNIYTLAGEQRIQSAGNALPMDEVIVPVGVKIDAEGEYTFRMPDGTEGMVVELIDYETNTRTNLLLSDYIVTLPKGTNEGRFALHIQPSKSGVTTDIDQINGGSMHHEGVQKYLIDGKLIIRTAEGEVFDAQGHRL